MGIDVIVSRSLNYTHFMYTIGKGLYLDIVSVVMIFLFSFLSLHFLLFFNLLNFYLWCTYSLPRYLAIRYSLLRCCVILRFSNTLIVTIKTSPLFILFEGTFAPKKVTCL